MIVETPASTRTFLNDYSGPNPTQTDNNGNIYRMDHFVPNVLDGGGNITSWVMATDEYLYDSLNRLTRVTETPTGGSGPSFVQQYLYDRWGNRRIDIAATSNVGGGVTDLDFKVLTANNRLVAPSDTTGDNTSTDLMRYDKAGNLVFDNYSPEPGKRGSMVYDAENRMTDAVNGNHQYRYEADGKRTRRTVAGQPEMWHLYGVNGELVAEYQAVLPAGTLKKEYGYRDGQLLVVYDGTLAGNDQLKWMVTDHLGSTRMIVNRSGDLGGIQRRDYAPFGEELASSIGHRNASGSGYAVNDSPRQKFTGYERDTETGLDFAQARYYANVQGRFTGVDPYNIVMETQFSSNTEDEKKEAQKQFISYLSNPQRWNRYSYCLNSPLLYTDPNGEDVTIYYRRPNGSVDDFGHILIYVKNDETGEGAYFDYYPEKGLTVVGNVSQDRINDHASFTIETNATQEQAILDAITDFQKSPADYSVGLSGGNQCTTMCSTFLEKGGLGLGKNIFPSSLWNAVWQKYGQRPFIGPLTVKGGIRIDLPSQPGKEFGKDPRGQARKQDANAANADVKTFYQGGKVKEVIDYRPKK